MMKRLFIGSKYDVNCYMYVKLVNKYGLDVIWIHEDTADYRYIKKQILENILFSIEFDDASMHKLPFSKLDFKKIKEVKPYESIIGIFRDEVNLDGTYDVVYNYKDLWHKFDNRIKHERAIANKEA